ncbi:aminotransferase, L0031 family [Candidatus Magnetobacterium bavaricum]|uniref:GDP-perosamine synthase n=1 Tax=Candidatus Magnetobacterium bavaricum TaxID=29290 RepID=A0A0F3GHS0_9BACT|nr:aminotransferase, L0031 family [Candidatus Magnetobacterium bavaricum]
MYDGLIPLSVPEITGNEWKYIKECLDNGWVSSVGDMVNRFETKVANHVKAEYAVATVNCTSALHLSLIGCGVEPGDEVIVPTLTFIATVNVVRYCGAYPVFMDCDPETLCVDINKVTQFLRDECVVQSDGSTYNKTTGRRVKSIISVHTFGHPADMYTLMEAVEGTSIHVIEDAAESLGSLYKDKHTGILGKVGCFSFNGNKLITTGGGGMIVTNNRSMAERVRHLSTQAKKDAFEYDHDDIGYNYRLTNIQAAMGIGQMERIDEFIAIKRKNALIYRDLLSDLDNVEFLWEQQWVKSNFWFYTIRSPKTDKKNLMDFMLSNGIQVRPIWKLIHTLPMYKSYQAYAIDKAIDAYDSCINLPCSVGIKESEIIFVVNKIKNYFSKQ